MSPSNQYKGVPHLQSIHDNWVFQSIVMIRDKVATFYIDSLPFNCGDTIFSDWQ